MYWVWANERKDEYELRIDGVPPSIEEHNWNFDLGQYVVDTIPLIDVPYTMEPDERLTDNLVAPGCRGLLVNKKVKSIFHQGGVDNMQYFPARLIDTGSREINQDYVIANIIGKVDCLDYARSELELDEEGQIQYIDSLSIKDANNKDYGNIFRLSAFLPVIIVSTHIKEAMEQNGITGITFYRPEEFSL